jgi:hypothetical protein
MPGESLGQPRLEISPDPLGVAGLPTVQSENETPKGRQLAKIAETAGALFSDRRNRCHRHRRGYGGG